MMVAVVMIITIAILNIAFPLDYIFDYCGCDYCNNYGGNNNVVTVIAGRKQC